VGGREGSIGKIVNLVMSILLVSTTIRLTLVRGIGLIYEC
jgi:hypothetical protein